MAAAGVGRRRRSFASLLRRPRSWRWAAIAVLGLQFLATAFRAHGGCAGLAGIAFAGALRPGSPALRSRGRTCRRARHTSRFQGVTWHERSSLWQAHVKDPASGTPVSLGTFESEVDAAQAWDCAQLGLQGRNATTNFELFHYSKADIVEEKRRLEEYYRPRPSAEYNGVYTTRSSSKWKAEIKLYGLTQFLAEYDTEIEAAKAVDAAIRSTGAEKKLQLSLLNFKEERDYFREETWQDERTPRGEDSCFLGVTYHQPSGKYLAKLGRRHVGLFESELDAARAFDEASHAEGGLTNFWPGESG